jgi:hypothetical protein
MSKPATTARPPVARIMPVRILTVVDLPAPFGPRKPRISPGATDIVKSTSACFDP